MRQKLKHLFILLIPILFECCSNGQAESHPKILTSEFITVDSTATLVIKNKDDYSKAFLDELKSFTYSKYYQLADSLLIIGKSDTMCFPTDLPLNTKITFSGCKNKICYGLTVERKNYTTVLYKLETNNNWKDSKFEEGQVELGTGFFLASEIDEDDITRTSYGSTEYTNQGADCGIGIRIGKNEEGHLCAKLKKYCKDKTKDINLADCPTLRRK